MQFVKKEREMSLCVHRKSLKLQKNGSTDLPSPTTKKYILFIHLLIYLIYYLFMISPDQTCCSASGNGCICSTVTFDVWRCVKGRSPTDRSTDPHMMQVQSVVLTLTGIYSNSSTSGCSLALKNCKMHGSSELLTSLRQNEEVVTMFLNEAMESFVHIVLSEPHVLFYWSTDTIQASSAVCSINIKICLHCICRCQTRIHPMCLNSISY